MPNIDEQDELLRKKLEETTFDYSDKYWEKARQMLRSKPRRKFAWWWFASAILPLAIASIFYFGMTGKNQLQKSIASSDSKTSEKINAATIANSTGLSKTEKDDRSVLSSPNRDNSIQSKPTGSITSKKLKHQNLSAKTNLYATVKYNKATKKTSATSVQSNADKLVRNKITANPAKSMNANSIQKPNAAATAPSTSEIIAANNDQPNNINAIENNITDTQNNIQTTPATSADNNPVSANSIGETVKPAPAQPIVKNENENSSTENPANAAKQLLKNDTSRGTAPLVANKVDSGALSPASKIFFRKKIFALNAGANFNKGIRTIDNNTFTVGALPYVGATYSTALGQNNKQMLQWGLQLCAYNKLNAQTNVHHSNYYSFGYGLPADGRPTSSTPVYDSVFTLKPEMLFTLQLPVVFNYYIDARNSFCIGAGISYTLGIYSKVTNFSGAETNSFGYSQGFNPFNGFIQVGYKYNLNDKWALELTIQQGFTDLTENSFFGSDIKNRITNVRLGLKREFIIKSKKIFYDKK